MDIWEILDIESTSDQKAIKRAYAKKLKIYNPEDNEEEFMKLRQAYESALKWVGEENEEEVSYELVESEVDIFLNKCKILYSDFIKRIKVENWISVFESEEYNKIANNLNTSEELNIKLLVFLLKNRNIPTRIWKYLNSIFFWIERNDFEKYFNSEDVCFIKESIISKWDFDFDILLEYKGLDYDKFINHRRNAKDYLVCLELENAINSINIAKSIFSKDPDLTRLEGQYYINIKEFDKALETFSILIELEPNKIDGYIKRASILKRKGDIKLAYKDYQRILEIEENNEEGLNGLGEYYISIGEYTKGENIFKELLEKDPYRINWQLSLTEIKWLIIEDIKTNKEEKLKLIKAYYDYGDYISCGEEIYNLINEGMISKKLYWFLGLINKNWQAYENAISYFNKYKNLNKESNYEVDKEIAFCYINMDKQRKAIKIFEQLLNINPDDVEVLKGIGELHISRSKYKEALGFLNLAAKLDEKDWDINFLRSICYYNLNEFENCIRDSEVVLEEIPFFGTVWFKKGYSHMVLGENLKAIESFEKAYEYGEYESYIYLSYINLILENLNNAEKYANIYLEEYEDDVNGNILLADILRVKGNYNMALELYNKAKEISEDYPEYNLYISYCYIGLGYYENALANYSSYISKAWYSIKDKEKKRRLSLDGAWLGLQCNNFKSMDTYLINYSSISKKEDIEGIYHFYDGLRRYAIGRMAFARLSFEDVLEREENSDAYIYLAMISLEQSFKNEAEEHCRKALELEADNPMYKDVLKTILESEIKERPLGSIKLEKGIGRLEISKKLRHEMYTLSPMIFEIKINRGES